MIKRGKPVLLPLLMLLVLTPAAWSATDHVYSSPTGTATTPTVITDNWDGGNVTVTADDTNAYLEVGNVGDGVAGNLTITTTDKGNASLLFGSKVTSVDDQVSVPPKPPNRINFSGDATLTGHSDGATTPTIGTATLKIDSGKILSISGLTTVKEYSRLELSGTDSAFLTGEFLQKGAGSVVSVTGGSVFRAFGPAAIEEGRFEISGSSTATFWEGLTVDGSKSVLAMQGGALIDLSEETIKGKAEDDYKGTGVWLENGGTLHATGTGNVIRDVDRAKSYVYNESGYLLVDTGGDLTAEKVILGSNYTSDTISYGTEIKGTLNANSVLARDQSNTSVSGTMAAATITIQDSAKMQVSGTLRGTTSIGVTGGTVTVDAGGTINTPAFQISGGIVSISGTVANTLSTDGLMTVSGGAVTVETGGRISTQAMSITGADAAVSILSGGIISTGVEVRSSNGILNLHSGSNVGETAGLGELSVYGYGVVNVNTSFTTKKLSFGGGTISMGAGGAMDVVADSSDPNYEQVMGGNLYLRGGKVTLHNDVLYNDGGIYGTAGGGSVDLNNKSMRVDVKGGIYAGDGGVSIDNVGDFTLNGYYTAGYVGGSTTMLTVTGMKTNTGTLSIGSADNQIQITRDLQVAVNSALNLKDGYLILKTDALNYSGDTEFKWEDVYYGTYIYKVKQDPITLEYGLYVTESIAPSREAQKQNILAAWREHPEVLDDGVRNVLNDSMLDAIIDGTAIRIGRMPGYDSLDRSGKFNAGVLSTLVSPSSSTYDALMLYNGSGLGMVNSAIVNSNQEVLRRIGMRNNFIRREMDQSCVTLNPGCDFEVEEPEFEPGNRLWVTGNYTSDTSGHHVGFAGYKYRGEGILLGYDHLVGRLALGAAVSYMTGDFTDSSAQESNSDIDTFGAYLYGNYNAYNGLVFSGVLGYAYSDSQIRDYRTLDGHNGWNTADYGANSLMASVNVGTDFWLTERFSLTPSVGFSYVRTHNSDHEQYFTADTGGVGGNTLSAGKVKGHSAQVPLDLAAHYEWDLDDESHFTITGNVGYAYELNNKGPNGLITYSGLPGVGPVRIASRELGRHILNLGVNGKYYYKQYELGFGYNYTGKEQYNSHTFLLNAGVVF